MSDFLMTVLTEIETANEVILRAAGSRESLVSRTPLSLKLPRLEPQNSPEITAIGKASTTCLSL